MAFTRRQMLQGTGLALGTVLFAGCAVREGEFDAQSPVRIPEDLVEGADAFYATLCRQCQSSEGLLVRVMEGRAKKIEGNPDYPLNLGKHSARCEGTLQELYHPDRIQQPMVRDARGGSLRAIPWDGSGGALDVLLGRIKSNEANPNRSVLVTPPTRGHLGLMMDRFTRAFGIQHAKFETLEETVLRQSIKRVFGNERLPAFDIENARYILSFGADFLGNWLSPVHYSRQYGEFRQGTGRTRGTLVQVEPRFSLTAANADEWVPIKPGTEGILALSIATVIVEDNLGNPQAGQLVNSILENQELQSFRPDAAAKITGVSAQRIHEIAHAFAGEAQPGLALAGGSAGAQSNGLFNLMAAYTLNLLVGNVGRPGGVILNPASPLQELPSNAQATTFSEWKNLTDRMSSGEVDLALFRGVNPIYGLPSSLGFDSALAQVPFVVSFSSFMDETTARADLILPMHTSLEDWGDDVPEPGLGYQVLGIQQPVVRPFQDSRSFGDLMLVLAEELGLSLGSEFTGATFQEVLRDGAKRLRNNQSQDRRPGLVPASTDEEFWVGLLQQGGWWDTESKNLESASSPERVTPAEPIFSGNEADYPFHLIPFPSHSMGDGTGAQLPWMQATPDPLTSVVWSTWVEVNPVDARNSGLQAEDVVEIESTVGRIEAVVYIHPATPPGILSVPLAQGHTEYGRYAQGRGSNVMNILAPQVERETGALAWGATRVRLNKTGERKRMIKLEGFVTPIELDGFKVVQITRE
jgi:anaerobic selenocysteine-containing dehydrogenase